jgi:nucleotide-binding universal stress UspA family protein
MNADVPDTPATPPRRRLLVALDAAEGAERLLDIAADMAVRMKADLLGLFIEDTELLGLGDNPLVRTVSPFAGVSGAIQRAVIEQSLRRQIYAARAAFEQATTARRLQATFEVRRGRLAAMLTTMIETDIILVRRAAPNVQHTPGSLRMRINAATRQIVSSARRPVIVLDVRTHAADSGFGRIVALYDGSAETKATLLAAADIADRRRGDDITIIPIAASESEADALAAEAQDILAPLGHHPHIGEHTQADLAALCTTCATQGGVLVLHADHALLQGEAMARVIETIDCSVMVVR